MIFRSERIGDEIVNNLITKKVVCPNAVQNVGTFKEHQNDTFLLEGSLSFQGVSIVKVISLLMRMKTMWQVCLI